MLTVRKGRSSSFDIAKKGGYKVEPIPYTDGDIRLTLDAGFARVMVDMDLGTALKIAAEISRCVADATAGKIPT